MCSLAAITEITTMLGQTWIVLSLSLVIGVAQGCTGGSDDGDDAPTPRCIEITTLSVGRGVPEATEAAYQKVLRMLEREGSFQEYRIGLEGETRARAEFADSQKAEAVFTELADLVRGVDLLTIEWSECNGED